MFGGLRPVQWIGRYPDKKSDPSKPWVKDALPVRIARSALGPNLPHADLYVTAAHSLLIDGVLVPAEMLINGATITRYEAWDADELEYFHIKLESHDVVYAEGVPAETLLKVEESAVNFADYFRRYGVPTSEEARCAPYVHASWRARRIEIAIPQRPLAVDRSQRSGRRGSRPVGGARLGASWPARLEPAIAQGWKDLRTFKGRHRAALFLAA